MKKLIYLFIAVIAMGACTENPGDSSGQSNKKTGKLTMSVKAENDFAASLKAVADPALADFAIVIRTSEGIEWRRWDSYGSGITVEDIPEGNYTIEALHGTNAAAAWDAPYYFGKSAFSINAGQTTEAAVTATINNAKVTLTYTEKLIDQVDNIAVVVTGKDGGVLNYTPAESRDGYFAVPDNGIISIAVTGTRKSNGDPLQINSKITSVQAAKWYKVNLDLVSTSGTGNVQLGIDKTLVEKDQNIEIPEEDDITNGGGTTPDPDPEPTPAPSIIGASFNGTQFDIDQMVTITPADIEAGGEAGVVLDVLIGAESGISNLNVEIISETLPEEMLSAMGLWGVFDMANPTELAEKSLSELKLIDTANPIKGNKSHTFSVGGFMSLLSSVGGAGFEHTFKIEVVDANGNKTTKALKIYLTE